MAHMAAAATVVDLGGQQQKKRERRGGGLSIRLFALIWSTNPIVLSLTTCSEASVQLFVYLDNEQDVPV